LKYINAAQSARISFYRAFIKVTRLISGTITVAVPPSSPADENPEPIAVLLWLPPHKRMGPMSLLRSGLLYVLVFEYGWRAIWNIHNFERDIGALLSSLLGPLGIDRAASGCPLLLATASGYTGKGCAGRLMEEQIRLHKESFPGIPIVVDTSSERAMKLYEKLGFRFLGKTRIETGTDAEGIKLAQGVVQDALLEHRVLMLEP
jgi:GNAT superfamily N-acetyltransferase